MELLPSYVSDRHTKTYYMYKYNYILIGVHALDINPYLHECFEPISID